MKHMPLESLQAWLLGHAALGALSIRMDAPSVESLQTKLLDLQEQAESIQAKADAESRGLTDDERQQLSDNNDEFIRVESELEQRVSLASRATRLGRSLGRESDPPEAEREAQPQNQRRRPGGAGGVGDRVPAQPRDTGNWGWGSFGQFAAAVRDASRNGGYVDPRLVQNAPTTFGAEGVGEDGGFAVPPDMRAEIAEKVMGEETLIGRTDGLQSSSNTVTMPIDETTPWQTTGGVQAYWENEAAQFTQSKPLIEPVSIRLNKLTALVPITEELLEDAPALDTYLRRKAPQKMDYKVTDAIVNGIGAGQPLGILKAPSLVTIAKEGSQVADTVVFANINKMWSRMYAPWRASAVWLINQDIEPQLHGLSFPGSGTAVPVYLPPGGLSAAPFGTILGRPVLPTQACQTLGDLGDIILTDLNQYMTITKTGGIRTDTSIHLWFDYDMMAFRFILRVAGQPWWRTAISPANGANTLSWAVTLAARA